jgi:hypothetical protein
MYIAYLLFCFALFVCFCLPFILQAYLNLFLGCRVGVGGEYYFYTSKINKLWKSEICFLSYDFY